MRSLGAETRINLLPWRDWRQARRGKATVAVLLGAALAGMALVLAISLWLQRQIELQENRIHLLEQELAALDQRMEAARDLRAQAKLAAARVALIRELRDLGAGTVRVFDALANTLAEGIQYRRIERRGRMLDVAGVAESSSQIVELMRNLEGSAWFASANLRHLREEPERDAHRINGSTFAMTVLQAVPVELAADGPAAASNPGQTAGVSEAVGAGANRRHSAAQARTSNQGTQ